ncbi:phenazine biosynthesis phzf protein [Trichococcus collinsii]|uniref:Phenazine biosynthesis-like protein n=1 Tax=Trichococcus collinsii TaxID=157076 RepID=A0AB38A037_9LACT|nr:phenazine biosynthesis phzf protein [Trichococcus collinsii]SEA46048.1 Phenazine biosynthesis-like protein [Trichococcus collinsii]
MCVLENEEQVIQARPDKEKMKNLDGLLLQLTAKGKEYDCITRSFAPKLGVWEDPVCGSGHCHVIQLWEGKMYKTEFRAFQASQRKGKLYCRMEKDRVLIAGKAALYSVAELSLP